ncbi:MAG: PIN domain-containing protein [Pyrinomonadaceae bacterium]
MKSLDTNIIIRFLLRDVPNQSARAIALVAGGHCYVTDVIVTETVFVLEKVYKAPRDRIAFSLGSFMSLPSVVSNAELFADVFELYQAQPSLSIIDCYAAVEAGSSNSTFVTFDKKLLRHGGTHVEAP